MNISEYLKERFSNMEKHELEELVSMKFDEAKITFAGKTYRAGSIDYVQTPGEYPMIQAKALMNPYNVCNPNIANPYNSLTIKNVIFNPPATIVFWSDNTKTVVKCDGEYESYDPEKGIAMAISKKTIGDNKYEYYNTFKRWLKKWDKQNVVD